MKKILAWSRYVWGRPHRNCEPVVWDGGSFVPKVFDGVIDFNWSRSTSSVVRSFRAPEHGSFFPVIHHGEEKNGSRLGGTTGYGQKKKNVFAHNPSIEYGGMLVRHRQVVCFWGVERECNPAQKTAALMLCGQSRFDLNCVFFGEPEPVAIRNQV